MAETKRSWISEITKGFVKENPVLRLILGTCPTLAVTTSVENGIGMGIAATFVLIGSNVAISALRKFIPDKVRIPAYITIIAGFVTVVQLLLKAFVPSLDKALGIFIPLIVVNCIILARAEMFANKNPVGASALDGLGMGIGFTSALIVMGAIREAIGNGTILGYPLPVIQSGGMIEPILILILPPGGFFVFGILVATAQRLSEGIDRRAVARGLKKARLAPAGNAPTAEDCAACGLGCASSVVAEASASPADDPKPAADAASPEGGEDR